MQELGYGIFSWESNERRSQRYGSVFLDDRDYENTAAVNPTLNSVIAQALEGKVVRIEAVVEEARESGHCGDFAIRVFPKKPEVGERLVLGVGILKLIRNPYSATLYTIALFPQQPRDKFWLDPEVLYRLHDQTVRLFIEETSEADLPVPDYPSVPEGTVFSTGEDTADAEGRPRFGMQWTGKGRPGRIMPKIETIEGMPDAVAISHQGTEAGSVLAVDRTIEPERYLFDGPLSYVKVIELIAKLRNHGIQADPTGGGVSIFPEFDQIEAMQRICQEFGDEAKQEDSIHRGMMIHGVKPEKPTLRVKRVGRLIELMRPYKTFEIARREWPNGTSTITYSVIDRETNAKLGELSVRRRELQVEGAVKIEHQSSAISAEPGVELIYEGVKEETARLLDLQGREALYLTNARCKRAWGTEDLMQTLDLPYGSQEGRFYPLTDEESLFVAEAGFTTPYMGRALFGYSALFEFKKWFMPCIEYDNPINAGIESARVRSAVEGIGGKVLIREFAGAEKPFVVQLLFPVEHLTRAYSPFAAFSEWMDFVRKMIEGETTQKLQ